MRRHRGSRSVSPRTSVRCDEHKSSRPPCRPAATASSAESEISNSATALPNLESPARSSATPFSKPESKMRNCSRVPGNFRRRPRNALAAARNAKARPNARSHARRSRRSGPITSSSRDDSDCLTSKGSRLAAYSRAPSIGHRESKAVEPIRCGDPDRPARPLRPDKRFNRQRRYGGNGVGCCNACSGGPNRNGGDVMAVRVPCRRARPSDITNTRHPGRHVAPLQRRDRLNRKYRTLKRRCRALNRLYGAFLQGSAAVAVSLLELVIGPPLP